VLAGADKSVDDNSKKVVGTSGPNTSVIAPGETPLSKIALEKTPAISNQQGKKLAKNKISTPCTVGKKSLEKSSAISKLQEEKLANNKSSTPPTVGKQALKKPSSAISKQQEKEITVNKTSKRPTRKRSNRNTKENRWYMTNPKQSKSDTKKNPWDMDNPNYKFGKSLLIDGDLKKATPFTRKFHKFYMQRGKSNDDSHNMVALRPDSSAWPPRWSNELQQLPVQLSDLYDLFNLDALDLTLLRCFIL
jgi:glucan-binding YG repeat protein